MDNSINDQFSKVNSHKQFNMKNNSIFIFLIAVSILFSCKKEETTKSIDPIAVDVITVGAYSGSSAKASSRFSGVIKAKKTAQLSFQVSGNINNIAVSLGEYVQKGDLVASIDATSYREQYEAKRAQAELAKENYTRINEVYLKGSIAEIRMVEARSNYKQAQAAANAAYENVKKTQLKAPFSGYIGAKLMEVGDVASPGMPVLQLLDTDQMQAVISLSDQEVNNFKEGDSAVVKVEALNKQFSGVLTEVSVQTGKQTPVYEAKITLPNPDRILKAGMSCKAMFPDVKTEQPKKENSEIILPVNLVSITDKGEHFVYLVDQTSNTAKRQLIEVGNLYNEGIAITNGLKAGDQVISSGYHKLTNNTPITLRTK